MNGQYATLQYSLESIVFSKVTKYGEKGIYAFSCFHSVRRAVAMVVNTSCL
jgi:hypothetical protein